VNAAIADGYTVVICPAPACSTEQSNGISAALRDCVRFSQHGVLIVSGCYLGAVAAQRGTGHRGAELHGPHWSALPPSSPG
jgi:hypothetical protein